MFPIWSSTPGIRLDVINLGGGIGIPYRPEQQPVDLLALGESMRRAYESTIVTHGLAPMMLAIECG